MTETTENIRLAKESEDEFYSVHTVNENLDKIDEAFGKKVDKKEGKELSSNDYTDEDKEKLDGIEAGAQANRVRGVKGSAQETYQEGLVNLTKEDIGLAQVNNTADKDKHVSQAVRLGMPRILKSPSDQTDYPIASFTVEEFSPSEEAIPGLPSDSYYHIYTGQSADGNYATQLALGMTVGNAAYRYKVAGVWSAWNSLIFSGNIGNFALPVSGGEMTGRIQIPTKALSYNEAKEISNAAIGILRPHSPAAYFSIIADKTLNNYIWSLGTILDDVGFYGYTEDGSVYHWKFAIDSSNGNVTSSGSITAPTFNGNATTATKAAQDGSGNVIENTYAKKSIYGDDFISMGRKEGTNVGTRSFVFSTDSTATDKYSAVLGGSSNTASGYYSVVLGGFSNTASNSYSVVLGGSGNTTGIHSTVLGGSGNTASGMYSAVLGGSYNKASNHASAACGKHNKSMTDGGSHNTQVGDVFVIGNGTSDYAKSNALRVTYKGDVLGTKAFQSSGADYAEFIKPWADGNPENEDRIGCFVTIKDGLLHKANEGDYIAGITSGNPSVVGNADEDYYWRYERDEFNRIVMEDMPELAQEKDEEGNPLFDGETGAPVMVETGRMVKNARMKLAEGYDPSMQDAYVPRADRPEWDYVGMVGVVPVRDDGTCMPGSFCRCGGSGVATLAPERRPDCFFVLERISDCVVSVILK